MLQPHKSNMNQAVAISFGIGSFALFVGSVGYVIDRMNAPKLKLMEVTTDVIAVDAWDKLSTRAILKHADKDLKTYFMKEHEYGMIVRDFQAVKSELVKDFKETTPESASLTHIVGLQQVLNRLRGSPFFKDEYHPEYDALWVMLTGRQIKTSCGELIEEFPKFKTHLKATFKTCEDDENGEITIIDAVTALERKLSN